MTTLEVVSQLDHVEPPAGAEQQLGMFCMELKLVSFVLFLKDS